jgi:hypothetical protein
MLYENLNEDGTVDEDEAMSRVGAMFFSDKYLNKSENFNIIDEIEYLILKNSRYSYKEPNEDISTPYNFNLS